jgi:hypothetical protein
MDAENFSVISIWRARYGATLSFDGKQSGIVVLGRASGIRIRFSITVYTQELALLIAVAVGKHVTTVIKVVA